MKRTAAKISIALSLAALMLALLAPSAFAALTTKANHDDIQINLTYNGSEVSVAGTCDPGADLVMTIGAYNSDPKLKKVDKVGGIVWMNTDEITFGKTPSVYFIRGTKNVSDLLNPEQLAANNIGYDALKANAELKPAQSPEEKNILFGDFIKYQESKGFYGQSTGDIDLTPADGGSQNYRTVFDWPYSVPPGEYQVNVYEIKDGAVLDHATSKVTVEEVGAVKSLADMATENGALYGVAAIGVALTTGFGVGMVFGKGGGAH